ncbi:MAG: hypothetical protein M3M96_09630 [Candidatus Eremiobacteraeota bacterium]|nr:hypothetical protein [Candidatus Eremiobacteraeota bacterium]
MPDPFDEAFTSQNPIVAAASRLRAKRDMNAAIDSATPASPMRFDDAEESLEALASNLQVGTKRLNSILGKEGVKFVRLQRPLRVRLRFGEKRIALDLDEVQQLVKVRGSGLDGDYQFSPDAPVPALINISKISTEAGYGEALTASSLLKIIAADAALPRPPHLDSPGPLRF